MSTAPVTVRSLLPLDASPEEVIDLAFESFPAGWRTGYL